MGDRPQKGTAGKVSQAAFNRIKKQLDEVMTKQKELEKSQYKIVEMGFLSLGRRSLEQLDSVNDTLRQMVFQGAFFAKGGDLELSLIHI